MRQLTVMVSMTFISHTEAAPEAMEILLDQRESLRLGSDRGAGIMSSQKKILVPNILRCTTGVTRRI